MPACRRCLGQDWCPAVASSTGTGKDTCLEWNVSPPAHSAEKRHVVPATQCLGLANRSSRVCSRRRKICPQPRLTEATLARFHYPCSARPYWSGGLGAAPCHQHGRAGLCDRWVARRTTSTAGGSWTGGESCRQGCTAVGRSSRHLPVAATPCPCSHGPLEARRLCG